MMRASWSAVKVLREGVGAVEADADVFAREGDEGAEVVMVLKG